MASIDSRSAGILSPLSGTNTDDPVNVLRDFIAKASGLPLTLVRKRWAVKPSTRPSLETDWCSVAVTSVATEGTPLIRGTRGVISQPESGYSETVAHQVLAVSVEFYGPQAAQYADAFRDACSFSQNGAELAKKGLQIRAIDPDVRRFPDFAFEQWCDRYEVVFRVGRKTVRRYGVRDYAALTSITLNTEKD